MAGELQRLAELGRQLKGDSIRCTTAAGSGHPTSSMSAADLMAVLLAKYLKYDWDDPGNPNNDRLIFSKGHASPLLYAMYKAAGVITDGELLSLRKFGSRLEGHPKPLQSAGDHGAPRGLPWVEVATGSLGQGLPIGVGMALSGKYVDKLPFHVWVLMGDSEMADSMTAQCRGVMARRETTSARTPSSDSIRSARSTNRRPMEGSTSTRMSTSLASVC